MKARMHFTKHHGLFTTMHWCFYEHEDKFLRVLSILKILHSMHILELYQLTQHKTDTEVKTCESENEVHYGFQTIQLYYNIFITSSILCLHWWQRKESDLHKFIPKPQCMPCRVLSISLSVCCYRVRENSILLLF